MIVHSFSFIPYIPKSEFTGNIEISLDESEVESCFRWFAARDYRWIRFVPESFRIHDAALYDKICGDRSALLCWPEELLKEIGVKFPNLSLWVCNKRTRNPLAEGGGLPIHIREELLPVIREILARVKDPDNPMEVSLDSLRGEYPGPVDEIEREARCYLEDYTGWEGKSLCFYLSKMSLCD